LSFQLFIKNNYYFHKKGTEFCVNENSTYREKKGVGSVISFHQLVTKNPNYEASNPKISIIYIISTFIFL